MNEPSFVTESARLLRETPGVTNLRYSKALMGEGRWCFEWDFGTGPMQDYYTADYSLAGHGADYVRRMCEESESYR